MDMQRGMTISDGCDGIFDSGLRYKKYRHYRHKPSLDTEGR